MTISSAHNTLITKHDSESGTSRYDVDLTSSIKKQNNDIFGTAL